MAAGRKGEEQQDTGDIKRGEQNNGVGVELQLKRREERMEVNTRGGGTNNTSVD